jgi:multiple sugar transport system substrate-binding protein
MAKKSLILLLIMLVTVVTVSAPPQAAAEENSIKLLISAGGSGKAYVGGVNLFNEKFKGKYHVEVDTIAFESLLTKLMTQFVAKTPFYDVVAVSSNWRDRVWRYLEPLNTYVKKQGPKEINSLYGAPELQTLTYEGKLVGLPIRTGADVLYYRSDLLSQAGLEVPKTLDELLAAARKLSVGPPNQRERYGFSISAQSPTFTVNNLADFLFMQGVDFLDKSKTKANPALKGKAAQQAFEIIKTMYDEKLMPNPMEWTYDDNIVALQQGKLAMTYDDFMRAPLLEKQGVSKVIGKMGYAVMPYSKNGPDKPRVRGGSWVFSIDKNSKNKVAAYEFIKFMAGYEAQYQMATTWANGPSVLAIMKDPAFLKANPAALAAYDSYSQLGSRVPLAIEQRPTIEKAIHDEFHQMLLNRISPKDVGKAIYQKISESL